MIAPIEMATGVSAYFIGKPNPLMMRTGLRILGVHSEEAVMIGDRMDTDMVAGIETGLDTVLVLSGVTAREDIKKVPIPAAARPQRRRRYPPRGLRIKIKEQNTCRRPGRDGGKIYELKYVDPHGLKWYYKLCM